MRLVNSYNSLRYRNFLFVLVTFYQYFEVGFPFFPSKYCFSSVFSNFMIYYFLDSFFPFLGLSSFPLYRLCCGLQAETLTSVEPYGYWISRWQPRDAHSFILLAFSEFHPRLSSFASTLLLSYSSLASSFRVSILVSGLYTNYTLASTELLCWTGL